MWKAETRRTYDRKGLRYPTDMTDAEWALARPFIDVPQRGSGQRRVVLREVLNAVFYILGTGCPWRALPKDLPPRSTVHDYFVRWQCDGTLQSCTFPGRMAQPSIRPSASTTAWRGPRRHRRSSNGVITPPAMVQTF